MSEDSTFRILNEALSDYVKKLEKDGKSPDEIAKRITGPKLEEAIFELISTMSTDTVDYIKNSMYERVMKERARNSEFMARNEQIWAEGFVASEAMYLVACDFADGCNQYIQEHEQEKLKKFRYRYIALRHIHGRSCQQYLEILTLLKAGFADGAFARWRSLYELSVIADFIKSQESEEVAHAFIDSSLSEFDNYKWALQAPCFSREKRVFFSNLQEACNKSEKWIETYKLSCKLVHASASGTFGRLGHPPTDNKRIAVGPSDYGLAVPAVNSAFALAIVSDCYFNLIPYGDSNVFIMTIQKWANTICEYYSKIEKESFSYNEHNSIDPSK